MLIHRGSQLAALLISLLLLSSCYHGDPLPAPEGPWEALGDMPQLQSNQNGEPVPLHP